MPLGLHLQWINHIFKCDKDPFYAPARSPASDPSIIKYPSATLFISAIKDGLMLSGTHRPYWSANLFPGEQ